MVQRGEIIYHRACALPCQLGIGIIDARLGVEEVADMSKQSTGIIALILGIIVLIWPSWSHVIFGVLLILIGVLLLMGKMKSLF